MKHGFSFDTDLCVGCKTCVAACTLENAFQTGTRNIYTYNNNVFSELSVVNLSLACNHCDEPVCLTGCPANAYNRDTETGVIIHDPGKCMGCSFCTWRCPFDAPKMNRNKGHVEKCSFCVHRLKEGIDPACVTACPTGALKHISTDEIPENSPLIPVTKLNPSLYVKGKDIEIEPVIYPSEKEEISGETEVHENFLLKEWSLIAFSSLITVAAGFTVTRYLGGVFPGNIIIAIILLCAVILSFAHLGKITKSWRAIINIGSSPLSREIMIVSLFMLISVIRLFYFIPVFDVILVFAAMLSLIAIDLVYISVDRSLTVITHSGQTLFSGLLIASYFSSSIKVFALLTFLAVASAVFRKGNAINNKTGFALFYLRQILLLLPLVLMTMRFEVNVIVVQVIVLTGVIVDRALFYLDFRPENIRYHIQNLVTDNYEKKRSKQSEDPDIS